MDFTIGTVFNRNRPRKRRKQTNVCLQNQNQKQHKPISCNVLKTIYKAEYNLSIGYILSEYCSKKTAQEKYNYINSCINNNSFFDEHMKNDVLLIVYKFQQIVRSFNILKQRFRLRKIKSFPCEDTFDCTPLKDIHPSQKIKLVELNTLYEFKVSDLVKVCMENLQYSDCLISSPKKPKNPFTNIMLRDYNIYNIYVKLKNTKSKIPPLFESYVKNNMNLCLLYEYNDIHLNWIASKQYIDNMEQPSHINYIHTLFNVYTDSSIKLHLSQSEKDYIVEFFKTSIYCDCYIVNFEPSAGILHQKTKTIIHNLNSFIKKHPQWIKKRQRLFRVNIVNTQRSNVEIVYNSRMNTTTNISNEDNDTDELDEDDDSDNY